MTLMMETMYTVEIRSVLYHMYVRTYTEAYGTTSSSQKYTAAFDTKDKSTK